MAGEERQSTEGLFCSAPLFRPFRCLPDRVNTALEMIHVFLAYGEELPAAGGKKTVFHPGEVEEMVG